MNSNKLKLILYFLLFVFVCGSLFLIKYKLEANSKRFYSQGESFFKQGNYSDAYYNYKQINRFSELYTVSLLKQYICANKLEDKKTAHAKLTELIKNTKDDNIKPYALYYENILAMELNLSSKKNILKKFKKIAQNYPDNDFAYAGSYKAAILSDDSSFSKEKLIEYLKYAPVGKFSISALEQIKKSEDILTPEDKEIIAESYFLNSKYQEALKYYKDTDFTKNWFKISKCYKALNKKEEEKSTIIEGFNLDKSEVEEKNIDIAINRLLALYPNANKIQILQDLYTKFKDKYVYPTIVYNLAESSKSMRSNKLYEEIVHDYPDSIWASNSLWEIFWYNYSQMRYETCIKIGELHQKRYSKSSDAPRVAYWTARALLKEKKNQQAREMLYRVLREYPLSYYAFMSARRLKISKARKIIIKKPLPEYDINSLNKFIFKDDKTLMFLAENDDFETIDELKINDEYIKSWVMFKKENYPNSINTAKNKYFENQDDEEFSASYYDKELKLIYPLLYQDEINEYASKYKQSPYLFISIIREESHFNKDALSSAGAVGLVQLMPATASFIEKIPITSEALKNNNIRIGLNYYNYLVNLFDKNEYLAILSYNAGPGNIKKWLNNPYISSNEIDEFVENIPYLETKNYIKKVLSTYWIYFNVYK